MQEDMQDQSSRTLEDYWDNVYQRRWWFLLPLFICWGLVWGVGWMLPSSYQSDALILVEQQKVPDQYVTPNVTEDMQDRLQSMTQQILSRTRLQGIIDRFHLYPQHHGFLNLVYGLIYPADPVDRMRKDINIQLVQSPDPRKPELTAFRIYYSAPNAALAQEVNSELASLFIDENLQSQQQLSENTTAFLANQLAQARTQLEQQEAKVRGFKMQYLGELPDQLQSNVQILSGLQSQVAQTNDALNRAQQQKLYLESLLQQYQAMEQDLGNGDTAQTPSTLDKELKTLRLQLADARARYTDQYPDVIALKEQITKTEKLKKQIESEIASRPKSAKGKTASSTLPASGNPQAMTPMMQIQSQLKSNQLQIRDYEKQEKALQAKVNDYQKRLNLTPVREQELSDISRGYEESQKNYDSLLQKQMESQLATNLEQRQQGEQFRLIDPPSQPDKPYWPNHLYISVGGLGLGAALGIGLIALLELTDVRVRQEQDLAGLVPVKVLVGIPRLTTPRQERRRSHRRWAERVAVVILLLCVVAGNLFALYKG